MTHADQFSHLVQPFCEEWPNQVINVAGMFCWVDVPFGCAESQQAIADHLGSCCTGRHMWDGQIELTFSDDSRIAAVRPMVRAV